MPITSLSSQKLSLPSLEASGGRHIHRKMAVSAATPFWSSSFSVGANHVSLTAYSRLMAHGTAKKFCNSKEGLGRTSLCPEAVPVSNFALPFRSGMNASSVSLSSSGTKAKASSQQEESSEPSSHFNVSLKTLNATISPASLLQSYTPEVGRSPFLSIAVIGATGELARRKIFPALFALYYSGNLPANFAVFGHSRKTLTDEDLRSIVASTLTCRIDHQQGCEDKIDAFLRRTYFVDGGYDNREGMFKLTARMEQVEGQFEANRIYYLSVPQEALLDVAFSLSEHAQTQKGWSRIIIEKPFGLDLLSSDQFTQSIHSKFEEKQLYRIDHLLGRNTIENLAVLRFSNLVFMPLWNRNYIDNIQVVWSDDLDTHAQSRYLDGNGIIGDVVHSHILQTIALLAMEPPISLDGEDVRNEKVKVLRSIQKLEPSDVIIGRCKSVSVGNSADNLNLAPTYFAAALYIDNARWDGIPFLIKAGRGLGKNRVEIRIHFRHVPGNLYLKNAARNNDLATNELILRDAPDEAILVRVNNKVPGLGMELDASELNLLYKDKYNVEVPDSYEQLLHDVIDGDNHLFMRSDEVSAAWNILSPVLQEMGKNNIPLEPYEMGSRGPDKTIYLWAKHRVQWVDD